MHLHTRKICLSLCLFASPAFSCDYCERKVTLSRELADCYLQRMDVEIPQMENSGLPVQLINLSACETAKSVDRAGSSLPTNRLLHNLEPTLSFVLDAPAMRCLAQSIKDESWNPDQIKTFEVSRDCAVQ